MTIDEAIRHCEEVAEQNETQAEKIGRQFIGSAMDKYATGCRECAAEHRQLAEWLTELKELRNSVGAVKLSNMKEAAALIRTLKAELDGWQKNPFDIIAEICKAKASCYGCIYERVCPFESGSGNYNNYPEDWGGNQ